MAPTCIEKDPVSQRVQLPSPSPVEYNPGVHPKQTDPARLDVNVPAPQSVQALASPTENVPTPQLVHADVPLPPANVPSAHPAQALAWSSEYVPSPHVMHVVATSLEYWPAWHDTHSVRPLVLA